jgi:hypothetical protein
MPSTYLLRVMLFGPCKGSVSKLLPSVTLIMLHECAELSSHRVRLQLVHALHGPSGSSCVGSLGFPTKAWRKPSRLHAGGLGPCGPGHLLQTLRHQTAFCSRRPMPRATQPQLTILACVTYARSSVIPYVHAFNC